MARRGNMMHPGFLAGFIVLAVIAATLGYMTYEKSNQIEKLSNDLTTAKEKAQKSDEDFIKEKQLRIDEGMFLYGWDAEGNGAKSSLQTVEDWMLSRFAHRVDSAAKTKEAQIKDLKQKRVTVLEYEKPDTEFTAKFKEITDAYAANETNLKAENATLKDTHKAEKSELEKTIDAKQQTIDTLNVTVGDLNSQMEQLRASTNQQLDELRTRNEELVGEYEIKLSLKNTDNRKKDVIISKLEEQLKSLLQDPESKGQLEADGELINIDASITTNTAYINLGQNDRITRGMRFQVFQWAAGGTQKLKGEIVVREVYPYTAKVGIVSVQDKLDPIVVGDLVANIAYNRNPKSFALLGSFKNFTKEELRRLIEKEGGAVSDTIHAGIDYIVAGAFSDNPDDPENLRYVRAKEFHIQLLNEDEIRKYLRDYSN